MMKIDVCVWMGDDDYGCSVFCPHATDVGYCPLAVQVGVMARHAVEAPGLPVLTMRVRVDDDDCCLCMDG
jgi:hypothetical protein